MKTVVLALTATLFSICFWTQASACVLVTGERCNDLGRDSVLINYGPLAPDGGTRTVTADVKRVCRSGGEDPIESTITKTLPPGGKTIVGCTYYKTHPHSTRCSYSVKSCQIHGQQLTNRMNQLEFRVDNLERILSKFPELQERVGGSNSCRPPDCCCRAGNYGACIDREICEESIGECVAYAPGC